MISHTLERIVHDQATSDGDGAKLTIDSAMEVDQQHDPNLDEWCIPNPER